MVEALNQIFVSGVNFKPLKNGHENSANGDQRERLTEVILNKADPAFVSLTGHGEECDRPGLGGEHRKSDGRPPNAFVPLDVMAKRLATARAPQAVQRDC